MEKSIAIIFRLRKDQSPGNNQVPIYLRVTIDGDRFEWNTQRYIDKSKWMVSVGKVKGITEEAKSINAYLDVLKHKVYVYQRELTLEHKELNINNFKSKWLGIVKNTRKILETFKEHNKKMETLVGIDFADGTLNRYRTTYDHTANFGQN